MFRHIGRKLLSFYFVLFILFVYFPLFVLMVGSFNNSTWPGLPWQGFTLKWWEMFLADKSALDSIINSFMVALSTAFLATVGGLLAAFALVRHKFRGRKIFNSLTLMPMTLPYLLLGVAMLTLFRGALNLELSLATILVGHILVALPYATLVMVARLIGFDRSLEEAAMDLGANELTTFRKVTLPLLMPGLFSAAFLAFTTSLEDFAIAFFLSGYQLTVPVYIFGQLRYWLGLPKLTALSAALLSISFVLSLISALGGKIRR